MSAVGRRGWVCGVGPGGTGGTVRLDGHNLEQNDESKAALPVEARTTAPVDPRRAPAPLLPGTVDGSKIDEAVADGGLEELEKHMKLLQRECIDNHVADITPLVHQLAGGSSKYWRERGLALRRNASEIYSPPRVTAAANCQSLNASLGLRWI